MLNSGEEQLASRNKLEREQLKTPKAKRTSNPNRNSRRSDPSNVAQAQSKSPAEGKQNLLLSNRPTGGWNLSINSTRVGPLYHALMSNRAKKEGGGEDDDDEKGRNGVCTGVEQREESDKIYSLCMRVFHKVASI